ncbi:MAG: hypothetical protein M1839_009202 [Geoglossum umbratile]|nr:MAG: hypothetical protein M1839_009202 [Geoglossum umbratile]
MPPSSNEDQFKFLISCIRYSNNGRVDFGEVASECGIVSKGAAAKRYERMMKAHGIATAATPGKGPSSSRAGGESSKGSPTKKRKMAEILDDIGDDEEVFGNGIKSEHSGDITIKKETPVEQGNGIDELTRLDSATTKYGSGIDSAVEGSGVKEVLGHAEGFTIEGNGGGVHESIVID